MTDNERKLLEAGDALANAMEALVDIIHRFDEPYYQWRALASDIRGLTCEVKEKGDDA